jgi:hypothetical protein
VHAQFVLGFSFVLCFLFPLLASLHTFPSFSYVGKVSYAFCVSKCVSDREEEKKPREMKLRRMESVKREKLNTFFSLVSQSSEKATLTQAKRTRSTTIGNHSGPSHSIRYSFCLFKSQVRLIQLEKNESSLDDEWRTVGALF